MNLYFDTSALVKRYLNEKGDTKVRGLFDKSERIFVSAVTHVECASAFQRLLQTKFIDKSEYERLTTEIAIDFPFFETVPFDEDVKQIALRVIEKHSLKPLDAIQFASLIYIAEEVESFVVCDNKLKKCSKEEGFKIIDPTE
jgi:predicted nucleic acid-binding protein